MPYCPNCGTFNEDSARFCKNCGIELVFPTQSVTVIQPEDHPVIQPEVVYQPVKNPCPRCGSPMTAQLITEDRHAGCLTVLFYIFLALTVLGVLVLIPLALRKKTETKTYMVCPTCGYKAQVF